MKRLFAALKIHPDKNFIRLYNQLKTCLQQDKINWVDLNNVHLTLKFFGNTAEDKIEEIVNAIDNAVCDIKKFDLVLKDVGIFGSSYKPRVIWFGIENHHEIKLLYTSLKQHLESVGINYDRQNFVPHLTIGRIKILNDKKYFQKVISQRKNFSIQKEQTDKLILFESILRPTGAEYHVIEEFAFNSK